jgi:hypothetical protein
MDDFVLVFRIELIPLLVVQKRGDLRITADGTACLLSVEVLAPQKNSIEIFESSLKAF